MDTEDSVSVDTLRQYAHEVRQSYGGATAIVGKCDYICYDLKDKLFHHGIPGDAVSVEQRRIGPNGEENHYLCLIDGSYVEDATGTVWIDMSLDQFCDYNVNADVVSVSLGPRESIDRVRVMPPSDPRRDVYMSVSTYLERELGDL